MSKVSGMSGFFVKPAILTASETLTRNNSGRTHFLDNATGFTLTLPSPLKGLELEFIVRTAPTGNYVITATGAIIRGGVYTNDVAQPSDPNFETSGVTNIRFVGNASLRGDSLKLVSDGTYWYAKAFSANYDGITFLEQSKSPSVSVSLSPSRSPSVSVSLSPSVSVSLSPSVSPSVSVSLSPSVSVSRSPSRSPSASPS